LEEKVEKEMKGKKLNGMSRRG